MKNQSIILSEEQIREIADTLSAGLRCYYHLPTGEIEMIPDSIDGGVGEEEMEPWKEIIDKLDENPDDYYEFDTMSTGESFEIMTDFANSVDDIDLQNRLLRILSRPKPFRNFKYEIDDSGEYRQRWFDHRLSRIMEYVKDQIEAYNSSLE